MISSLVEWIENMDEWELKINILRFIGTVAYLLGAWSKTWISTSDLKTQAPGNKNILRLLSWNDGACFVRCCNGLYLLYILINTIKNAYLNLNLTVKPVFFWLNTVECDEFTYFASSRRFRSLMRLFCMSCTQPSQSGDSVYLNFHVFSFIVWAIFSPFGFPCWRSNSHVARNPLNILRKTVTLRWYVL